jgi:putative transposase
LGQALGAGVRTLLTIVAYPTYRRWVNQFAPPPPGTYPNAPKSKPGRPRTSDDIRQLVLRIARENDWGYTRVLGELKKLGIRISRSTVVTILRQENLDPRTDPTQGTWAQFLKAHGESLWQCDFFSKHIITGAGVRQCFILAFVHVSSRRVFLSSCTFKPDAAWMQHQARAFVQDARVQGLPAGIVLRDRDSKFTAAFDGTLRLANVQVRPVAFRSPNMNAYIERFVQSIQQECLDRFIVFGQEHLDLLVGEYSAYYHRERPHQAKGNRPLTDPVQSASEKGEIVCRERLCGVLRSYARKAA